MHINCPSCGSKRVRHSQVQGVGEWIATLLGRPMLRCKDCQRRFTADVWVLGDLRYARCPRCYRLDLTSWSPEHYFARGWVKVLLMFGARRLRCDYCRHNFAGYRPRKYNSRLRNGGPGDQILTQSGS